MGGFIMTHWIVTGRHRSGTSMLMRAIHKASDLPVLHDPSEDKLMRKHHHVKGSHYHPNPNGYFLPPDGTLPHDKDGHLKKISMRNDMWVNAKKGPNQYYMIAWIVRDEQERIMSWTKAFGQPEDWRHYDLYAPREAIVRGLNHATITMLDYRQMILNPVAQFTLLRDAGWPIDPEIAATYVDPGLYRNKL
jgi:hypothetical protein